MVKRISPSRLARRIVERTESAFSIPAGDHFVMIEIGPEEEYDPAHILRARHLPPEDLERRAPQVIPDHGQEIILYGAARYQAEVARGVETLQRLGYFNLFVLDGTKEDWIAEGLWIDTSRTPADHLEPGPRVKAG